MSSFHSFLERDSNFDPFVLVLSVSAQSILIDVDNSTFLTGALPKDSFYYYDVYDSDPLKLASTMTWVENFLNLTNGYYKVTSSEGDQFEYLIPFPPGFTSTMKAYWTTDVIVLDPSCSWQTATTPRFDGTFWNVTIPKSETNLSIVLGNDLSMFILSFNVFIFLLDLSNGIKKSQSHAGFCFRGLQQ